MNFISDSIQSLNGRQLSQLLLILGNENGAPGRGHAYKYRKVVDLLYSNMGWSKVDDSIEAMDRVLLMNAAEKLEIWESHWREYATDRIIKNIYLTIQ